MTKKQICFSPSKNNENADLKKRNKLESFLINIFIQNILPKSIGSKALELIPSQIQLILVKLKKLLR